MERGLLRAYPDPRSAQRISARPRASHRVGRKAFRISGLSSAPQGLRTPTVGLPRPGCLANERWYTMSVTPSSPFEDSLTALRKSLWHVVWKEPA